MNAFEPTQPLPPGITMLEASAGTGKTYTIASLVLRLVVEHGVPIDELLVVTFTEAATAELRDRVRGRLRTARDDFAAVLRGGAPVSDDAVVRWLVDRAREAGTLADGLRRLHAALEGFDTAAIFTIHGFCQRLLRDHAFECGADFDAELLEDADDLLEEIVHDFWAREVASRTPALARALLDEGDRKLSVKWLLDLARRVTGDPELPLVPALVAAPQPARSYEDRCREMAAMWTACRAEIERTITDAMTAKQLDGRKWQARYLAGRFAPVDAWVKAPETTVPPEKMWYFSRERMRESAAKGKEAPSHPFFDACDGLQRALTHEELALKHGLAGYARVEFAARKRARRHQTFDDLLLLVRDALRQAEQGDRVVAQVRGRFQAALIDEFQDTDVVQWEIFRRLFDAESHRLVLIGDPKQSIYGFRRADVHAYLAARDAANAVYGLGVNFRSDDGLVNAVNLLFRRVALPFGMEGIGYAPVKAHHTESRLVGTRESAGAPFRVRALKRTGPLKPDEEGKPIDKGPLWRELPRFVAADVAATLDEGLRIRREGAGGTIEDPVRPGNIAVLVRSNRNAREIQEALRARGIPSVLHSAGSVWQSDEAAELEAVVAAMLDSSSLRLSRAAVATDLIGIAAAAELVAEGRAAAPLGPGDALAIMDADETLWERWIERLRSWGDRWARRCFMAMFQDVVVALALPERLLALEDGERRLTNLRHLAELLHARATSASLKPLALLEWLHAQRRRPDGDAESRNLRLESDADAVQIVTVHSSKGLEYPIVFCPYLLDGALARDRDKVHVRFRDRGEGQRDLRMLDVAANDDRAAHLQQLDRECFEESLRLMYVALTRARHRCVVYWGNVKEGGSSPLGYLLQYPKDAKGAPEDFKKERERIARLSDEEIDAAMMAIEADSGGTIAVSDASAGRAERWRDSAEPTDATALAARAFRRAAPLDWHWRIGSFTGMTRDSHPLNCAIDANVVADAIDIDDDAETDVHEALTDARVVDGDAPEQSGERILLGEFPSSARAGICFHEVLEATDFAAPAGLPALVDSKLRAFGFDAERWRHPVVDALTALIAAPLGDGDGGAALRLGDVAVGDRLTELRFEFPVCGGLDARTDAISAASIARVFRDHPGGAVPASYAERLATLDFRPLRGFLQGAIDLVARQHDRWYLVDYKSNRLGATFGDYVPDRLQLEMRESHYFLQYHLYAVALHRYLRWRVPGYDYDRDFGGVHYLFFRGIGGAPGARSGVFFDRPPRGRIEALDALVAAVEPVA